MPFHLSAPSHNTGSHIFERVARIELASPAWQAGALTVVLYPQFLPLFIF